MSSIAKRFILEVFDTNVVHLEDFIENDSLNMTAIMKHPFLKLNVMYGIVWNLIFSTWPTKIDFHDYLKSSPSNQHDLGTICSRILVLKVIQVDLQHITDRFKLMSEHLNDVEFLRSKILDKWRWRFPAVDLSQNQDIIKQPLLHIFAKFINPKIPNDPPKTPTTPIKLPSGNIEMHPSFSIMPSTNTELMQYLVHKDIHFFRQVSTAGATTITNADLITAIEDVTNAPPIIIRNPDDPLWKFYPKLAKFSIGQVNLARDPQAHYAQLPQESATFIQNIQVSYYTQLLKQSRDLPFITFVTKYLEKRKDECVKLVSCASFEPKENVCILVDNRANPMSVASMYMAALNLDLSKWDVMIYTSKSAVSYYQTQVGKFAQVREWDPLNIRKFNIDVYNRILMSPEFWNSMSSYTKALIIQDDGVLVRKGIEKFLKYDYVGAPWIDAPENAYIKTHVNADLVGNGGLSLRTISVMKDICERYKDEQNALFYHNIIRVPEDVYFVRALCLEENKEKYNMPTSDVARKFAIEQIMDMTAIGLHKAWAYLPPQAMQTYFNAIISEITS